MSWHLSSVLLFLVLLVSTCGPACADNSMKNRVDIFVPGQTKVPDKVGDLNPVKDVKFFFLPLLVGADDVMTVLASTDYTDKGNKNTDIVAKYIGTHGMNWAEKVTEGNGSNWKTQLVIQKEEQKLSYNYQLWKPMAVAKGNKIYLLVLSLNKQSKSQYWTNLDWDLELIVGEVKPMSDAQLGEKTIEWQKPKSLIYALIKQLKDQSLRMLLYEGPAFLEMDKRIVFVMRALKGDVDTVVVVHMNDTGKGITFEWSQFEVQEGCYFPFVFGWGKKLIMVTYCRDESYSVKESVDMGKAWTDATGPISRLSDHWNGKQQFTTATIENKTVLFFSELRNIPTSINPQYAIHLGVTDGNRVYEAKRTVVDGNYISSAGLLYTNGELFSLYRQSYIKRSDRVFLIHLKDELERIKSVLKTWAEKDEYLSKSCKKTAPQGASSETFCITPMPTEGLVGFLSNTSGVNVWHDEYLFIGAIVKGGKKVENGFTFRGAGSGAWWPVGKQYANERYDFTKHGLTVVATVTIHEVPLGDTPLLTVGEIGDIKLLGLWYGKDMQWQVMSRNGGKSMGRWEVNQTYRVALKLEENNFFAYVDGQLLWKLLQTITPKETVLDIQQLFIGGYGSDSVNGAFSHVTVTNVFLYNRPLSDIELEALNEKTPATPKPMNSGEDTLVPTKPSEETTKLTSPSEVTLKPTSPSEVTLKPTRPSEVTLKPTSPSEVTLKPTRPSEVTLKPTRPSGETLKPTRPSEVTLKPTRPSEVTLKPTRPSEVTLKPTSPSEVTLKPTSPSEVTLKPTSSSEVTLKPTRPSEVTLKPTRPSEVTLKPTRPSEVTLKPTRSSEVTLKPTRPSEVTLKPTSPSEVTLKPTRPSGETLKPTRPSEVTLKPTRPSEVTLRPTNPAKKRLKPKSTGDSCVHVPLGVTVFFLLALWGLAAL